MTCITKEGLEQLRKNDKFNSWLEKIKKEYPSKSDEDIENTLVAFMEVNNGNFPGDTPFGDIDNPIKSETFGQLLLAYDGDEVRAMEIYERLFDKDFIEEFGNWCDMFVDTEGLTEEQIEKMNQENLAKLLKSVRNTLGEPALLFVNSVNHQAFNSASAAVTKSDANLPFKITTEGGEVRVIVGYDRPVQSGSITFIIAKNTTAPVSSTEEIHIDVDDVYKAYDFNSENKGFTEKRLGAFITQSSKDIYYISKQISRINGLLIVYSDDIHTKEDAISFIREKKLPSSSLQLNMPDLFFDTDETSPFGCILIMAVPYKTRTVWQIISPEGIFSNFNRYTLNGKTMTEKTLTDVDRIANLFFINIDRFKSIKDYITSNINTVKPDSYLSAPIVDYEGDRFILKPASNRTQHNIKTELGLTYAVQMFNKNPEKFKKYLNWAKQFSELRQNSAGVETIKDVNLVGNLIGSILSGQIIDSNYYTAHSFDRTAVEQAIFVSKHLEAIRGIVEELWKDVLSDIQTARMQFLNMCMAKLSRKYNEIDFSDITDNISKNRTISKLNQYDTVHSFCDSIDKAKAAYGYKRTDSGTKKLYDATEYTRISAVYDQLDALNKDIKEYLINSNGKEETVGGESLERLISKYFTCIDTIVSIMDDDISKIEDFIWHTPEKYTPEYYSSLLYFDRSVIGMYKKLKTIIEALFNLNSNEQDLVGKALYDIFDQRQVKRFEDLRSRYYNNYSKLSNLRTIHDKEGSLESIIGTMIDDAILHVCDDWCNKNLKCFSEKEELEYRENIKLDLEGHINAGMPLDTAIGGASSSGHSIINILYRIMLTQGKRSNLLIKQKGDSLVKQFKSVFNNHSPLNPCKQFCEMIDGLTTGYFIRDVNYGQYYRAKVAEQRRLLDKLPKNTKGLPLYFTINEDKSTKTKLFIEWGAGSDLYLNLFLDDMDRWIEANANRRYNAQYYIDRRRILGKERTINGNKIIVGNEAANRQNILRRQIDGIKNRYIDKETGVFLPSKVPPVLKKILNSLEYQLSNLSSPYEKYTKSNGDVGIREKTGLDLAIALNIQEWNKYIQDRRNYKLDIERYNEKELILKSRIGKDITKKDYDEFVSYYHRTLAKQEYYDALEEKYKGGYGEYQDEIDDIRFRRRSILSRVKHGKKGLLLYPNLDELTNSEWEELKRLDINERKIKDKLPPQFNTTESITSYIPVQNEATGNAFIDEHRDANKVHRYMGDDGIYHDLSVYFISVPADFDSLTEDVLVDLFSVEDSEYMNPEFDASNSSYEQPRAYARNSNKKLYKNDKYDEIKKDAKLFELYETFLNIMKEANQMFGYAAISSNYKLPQVYEREASVYIGRGCGVLNSFHYAMKRSFLIDERDLDRSYTSDVHADNSTSGKLRKRFVEMLSDPEHISTDLVYSVMAYYTVACRYSDKQDVQALCELINRKIASLENIHQNFKTQTNNTVETFLFENTMNTDSSVAAGFEKFMEHTTGVMLKWKLKTAIKAFIDGYRLFMNIAVTNKWNMRGHFLEAVFGSVKNTFTSIRSDIDVLDYNLDEALMSLNDINIQSFADTNKTKFTRAYYKSGMMPALTAIDHVTTKAIMRALYSSIRLYTNPDGKTKQFLNIDEFINMYKKHHPDLDAKTAEEEARLLFWGEKGNKVVTLRDAYQLKDNILSIKDEYVNMFSDDKKVNEELWAILLTRVEGLLNMMAATINGYKPEDTKAGNVMRKWYLKPIFLIRSFLIANYNELFKHSDVLNHMIPDTSTRHTNLYVPLSKYDSLNSTVQMLGKFWSSDKNIVLFINRLTSDREMYNVLTGSKDIGYYFGVMSMIRKTLENIIIYCGSIAKKEDPDYRRISDLEKISVINMFLVVGEALVFYNAAVFIGGLLCCLLGQGSDPDDEDEYFVHWVLWLLYDVSGSMVNEGLVNLPTGDTLVDIFKNIMAIVPAMEQFKKSLRDSEDALTFVEALFGSDEVFEDPEYGTDSSPFNLIKSGKWKGEMYGKRYFYEAVQNAPWLVSPWYLMPLAVPASLILPQLPIANLKESFSAHAAKAKASYTFNNLSPMDYFNLKTPSGSDESYEKFHNYGPASAIAWSLNSLIGGTEGEEKILDFIRETSKNPYTPVPNISPVDKVERKIPLGRLYE